MTHCQSPSETGPALAERSKLWLIELFRCLCTLIQTPLATSGKCPTKSAPKLPSDGPNSTVYLQRTRMNSESVSCRSMSRTHSASLGLSCTCKGVQEPAPWMTVVGLLNSSIVIWAGSLESAPQWTRIRRSRSFTTSFSSTRTESILNLTRLSLLRILNKGFGGSTLRLHTACTSVSHTGRSISCTTYVS